MDKLDEQNNRNKKAFVKIRDYLPSNIKLDLDLFNFEEGVEDPIGAGGGKRNANSIDRYKNKIENLRQEMRLDADKAPVNEKRPT
mmetsp:Transcript_3789/g.3238  ORF Transcript_3789/g.3238 Transcript_3789/m.3238 type:complete len:85 (-) Transcript_3789:177-431(-)